MTRPPRPAGPRAYLVFTGMCRCHWVLVLSAPTSRCTRVMNLVSGTANDPLTARDWPQLWTRMLVIDEALRRMERI